MKKHSDIKKSVVKGRFSGSAIGASKATKFLAVEGLSLNQNSSKILKTYEAKGLKGDALRAAITERFREIKRA